MAEKNFFLEMTAPVTMDDVWRSEKRKKQTNADRIRAMTDEELAEWHDTGCPPDRNDDECCEFTNCVPCWLEWLQEVSDGGAD